MSFFQNLFGNAPKEDLTDLIANGAFLVDVREPSEFASGSVKGAINIPLGSVSNNLSQFKGKPSVIVFCRSGNRSGQAKSILDQNGITNVVNGGTWENVQQHVQ
jgi:phage shock protein E